MGDRTSKLKILIPIFTFGKQGGFRVLAQLANHWTKDGHEVVFVAYHENELPYFPVESQIIWINKSGTQVENRLNNKIMVDGSLTRAISIYRYLVKNSSGYDVVLANQNLSVWPVWLGSKSKNFYYIQAYEPEFYSDMTFKGITQRIVAWLTYFLPITRVVNADIYRNYKNLKSKYVIPPGLDLDIYHPQDFINTIKKDYVIGCIGRIEEWKGSNDVTEAVKILHGKGYNVKYKVAFNPVNYDKFELVKPDGDKNLADFYRRLDILVAPGHIQLGAVHYPVIEAMACMTPVITTGYYPANNKNAYIVPIKKPTVIAETIIKILEDYEKAIEKAEIAYNAISQFDWKIVSAKFIDIFNAELEGDKNGKRHKG